MQVLDPESQGFIMGGEWKKGNNHQKKREVCLVV